MAKKSNAATTAATKVLTAAGVEFTLHPYEHTDGATDFGDEAARATGTDPQRIFKTLLVDVTGGATALVVAVVPVANQLDLKALAAHLGAKKASMADPKAAERATGMVVGAISPLGQKSNHHTVVDASASGFDTILVSAGRRGLQLEVSPADLVGALTDGEFADIAR